jgi:hypothetical protein
MELVSSRKQNETAFRCATAKIRRRCDSRLTSKSRVSKVANEPRFHAEEKAELAHRLQELPPTAPATKVIREGGSSGAAKRLSSKLRRQRKRQIASGIAFVLSDWKDRAELDDRKKQRDGAFGLREENRGNRWRTPSGWH